MLRYTNMVNNKWTIILMILISGYCFAQNETKKVPLTNILTSVEEKFNVKFSYSSNEISKVSIEEPQEYSNLQDVLAYLNSKTLLNFKAIDDRYITVSELGKTISICGKVISSENNDLLLGANILLKKSGKGTITNDIGEFKMSDVSIDETIIISFLGFKNIEISVKELFSVNGECRKILMINDNEELNQVIITKFLTTGLQKTIDGSIVLNTAEFGSLPGLIEPDILQSIQALPGVESVNESIANINIRGGTNDQNLMLWDDIKMYHSGHFFGLISAYNPYLTNKVIVTKNGTSSAYSDGVSSTINMFTKNQLLGKVSGGAGFNLINADAFLEIPISKNLEVHISGRRSFTDLINTPTYDNYFERSFQDSEISTNEDVENSQTDSNFMFYDYTAKLLYDFNQNHKFRANVIAINNNLDYSETNLNSDSSTESKSSKLAQENLGFGGQLESAWNSRFKTKLIGYYSRYNVDSDDYRVETDQRLTQANEVLDTGLKLNTFLNINDNLVLLNGYQFNETGILNETVVSAPSYSKTKKDVLLNHAFYSEIESNKGNTYLRAGARLNYFQKFNKFIIEPRLNIRHKLSNSLAIKLEGEFKNQSATQKVDFQNDFLGVENRRWILANEDNIPISTSKQASLGVDFYRNNLNVDLTGYYKEVNGITASNQGFYNNFQYLSATGNYTSKGVEFLANKTANNFSAWMSYSFSINNYEFESFIPAKFPNNLDIRHSFSLAVNYDILENLSVSLGGIYRSGQPYTKPVEGNETVQSGNNIFVNYDTPNAENLDDFMRLDMSLSYKVKISNTVNTAINFGIRNLTNQNNVINRYYQVDTNDSNKAVQIDNKSMKLTPNMSLRLNF